MRTNHRVFVLSLAAWLVSSCGSTGTPTRVSSIDYPETRKDAIVDTYHGVEVADPYRWLEVNLVDAPESPDAVEARAWIGAQNRLTEAFLAGIPARETIKQRLTRLWDYERYGIPVRRGGRYFFAHNNGLENQPVLKVADGSPESNPRVLLDPNRLAADGTVSLARWVPSEDGKRLAYAISSGGSDWLEWKVRDVDSGTDLPDRLRWSKFSGAAWTPDSVGFYYSRYPAPPEGEKLTRKLEFQKLYYHQLGTPQSEDVLVCQDLDHPDHGFSASVTDDGDYLCIGVWKGTLEKNLIHVKRLGDPRAKIVKLIDTFEASFDFLASDGTVFWFRTSLDAPRNRVIAIDIAKPDRAHWKEVIPEAEETLRSVQVVGNRFIAVYLKDAYTRVKLYKLDGTFERDLALPGIGTAGGFTGKREDPETFYGFSSFTRPSTAYRLDFKTSRSAPFHPPRIQFDPDDFFTRQVRCRSKDGTVFPVFITHKKGISLNGRNPTLLYGYGGFNIAMQPRFSVRNIVWLEMGGIYAQACTRGGGEYGREWHLAGTKLRKQNVFDDFIAAAEWLIEHRYTSTPKLAIYGHSNGGLLVGACLTQRPDLFGACLPGVGVLDMLRYDEFTAGHLWASDYGTSKDPNEFKALLAYSPLHNVRPGTAYPPTLITTADHDDRVVAAHSFKFAARLQACQAGPAPILIRIESRAGHGAGKPTEKRIQEEADVMAFLVAALKVD